MPHSTENDNEENQISGIADEMPVPNSGLEGAPNPTSQRDDSILARRAST